MIEIPKQLQDQVFRFIKIRMFKQGDKDPCWRKAPLETGWRKDRNYVFNDKVLLDWLKDDNNYGVALGHGNLCVVDCDTEEFAKLCIEKLPKTFTIRTGGGGLHLYYRCEKQRPMSFDADGKHLGEYKAKGVQVVGPGSIHPNNNRYKVEVDEPIANLSFAEFKKLLPKEIVFSEETEKDNIEVIHNYTIDWENMEWRKIFSSETLKRNGSEIRGAHPSHGSTQGKNFSFNLNDNTWFCFRHHHGGGVLELIAIVEGIITCDGKLSGEQRKTVKEIAKQKYGIKYADREVGERRINIDALLDKYRVYETDNKGNVKLVLPGLAELIHKEFNYHFFTAPSNEIYAYNGKFYHPKGQGIIEKIAKDILKRGSMDKHIKEIVSWIRMDNRVDEKTFDNVPLHLINMENGIYDLKEKRLMPHDPKYRFVTYIPVTYDEKATMPLFSKFLSQVLPNDLLLIQEIFGSCLYRSYDIQNSFMFVGSGSNGKSTLISVLRAFLGENNTTSVSLHDMHTTFLPAQLHGKLANLYADLSDKDVEDDAAFKMLCGGDPVTVQKKHRDPFDINNYAKLIFSCNKVPKAPEGASAAWDRRWIMVIFTAVFSSTDKTCDPFLSRKLKTKEELSGIFNWAVEGLIRLLSQNQFTGDKSPEEKHEIYTKLSDPLQAFVDDCIVDAIDGNILKDEFYSDFLKYCNDTGRPSITKQKVSKTLKNCINTWTKQSHDGTRSWSGIAFNDDWTKKRFVVAEKKKSNDDLFREYATTSDTDTDIHKSIETCNKSMPSATGNLKSATGNFLGINGSKNEAQQAISPLYTYEKNNLIYNKQCGEMPVAPSLTGAEEPKMPVAEPKLPVAPSDTSDTVSHIVVETSRNATSLNDMPQHDRIAEVRNYVLRTQPVTMVALLDHFEPDAFIYDLIQRGLLVRVPDKTFEKYEWMKD